ncbi:MAG TPA: serine kinase [bacterium]|nr:serine kinase [bacterium]
MIVRQLVEQLDLESLTPELDASLDVSRGYVSDMLSDVLANAPQDGVLVTIQLHLNVIAVAIHAGLKAVIFTSGRRPEENVIQKACEEQIQLFVSRDCSFDLVGRLYELGLRSGDA